MEVVYNLKEQDIQFFRSRLGQLIRGEDFDEKIFARPLIVVGDKSSSVILKKGIKPDIVVYDMKIERKEISQEIFDNILSFVAPESIVENPRSVITEDLWEEARIVLKNMPHKIKIIGEEDLATAVFVCLAPINSTVVYGIPGQGMIVLRINKDIKEKMRQTLGLKN